MKTLFMVFAMLASTAAFGNRLVDMSETDRCAYWARNAMYGATQYMRGASRDVEFINRTTLIEILKNSRVVGHEKLYILTQEGDTDDERGFDEKATLFGYDAMSSWKSRNAGLGPIRDEWRRRFMVMCLESAEI
jgi:hypothetical protein